MTGERNLAILIKEMKPQINPGEYVFCPCESFEAALKHDPIGLFQEGEGVTAILPKETADEAGLAYSTVMAWITLMVHSSLDAVGLTAAVSRALTGANISCNVVAAIYHDHLFVPITDAGRAIETLERLAGSK